jgi:hypothetical protein
LKDACHVCHCDFCKGFAERAPSLKVYVYLLGMSAACLLFLYLHAMHALTKHILEVCEHGAGDADAYVIFRLEACIGVDGMDTTA